MIRTGVTGIAGKMGSFIGLLVTEAEDLELAGALEARGHRGLGSDAGLIIGAGALGTVVTDDMDRAFAGTEVIIDFTVPEVTMGIARYASEKNKALVIGTTGLSDDETATLKSFARSIPIVASPT